MAIEPLRLRVITPVKTVVEAVDVAWVQVALADGGGLGIFPGHAPLLAETVAGGIRYADGAGEHTVEIASGIYPKRYSDTFYRTLIYYGLPSRRFEDGWVGGRVPIKMRVALEIVAKPAGG